MQQFRESAPAVPASVPPLRHAIVDYARSLGAADDAISSMQIAVAEAMSNAVVHAYVDSPEPGTIVVTAFPEGDDLCVVVVDDGCGMKPRPDSPGLGVGLPLMTSLTASLEFRGGDSGGTEVVMRFAGVRTGASASAAP